MKCVYGETGAISTGISHNASPQVTSTLTSRTIRPEGSDGNGSNDTLVEFDWNAHLSVPKMSTMHFFALCKGHSSSKDQFHKGEELPLTHRIPHTPGSRGHHNLVCFPLQIAASVAAASAPASGLFALQNHIGEVFGYNISMMETICSLKAC